jgi:hypothetical protein
MAGKPAEIQIDGMRETRRALKQASDTNEWKSFLKAGYLPIAQRVASGAQSSAAGSRMGHVAIASIVGKATFTSASIQAFKGVPWGPGFEFGSHKYRQFPPARKGGYNIYPTIAAQREAIANDFLDATSAALDRVFS